MLDATPHIADEAAALGMVPAGDSAMLMVDGAGAGSRGRRAVRGAGSGRTGRTG